MKIFKKIVTILAICFFIPYLMFFFRSLELHTRIVFHYKNWGNTSNYNQNSVLMPFGYFPSDTAILKKKGIIETGRFYIYNFKNSEEDFLLVDSVLMGTKEIPASILEFEDEGQVHRFCRFFWNTENNLAKYVIDIDEGNGDHKYLGLFRIRMIKQCDKFYYYNNLDTRYSNKELLNLRNIIYHFERSLDEKKNKTDAKSFDFIVWKQAYEFLYQKELNKKKGKYKFSNGSVDLFEFEFIDEDIYSIKIY
jgi:hypothetical protein